MKDLNLEQDLKNTILGDVHFDAVHRRVYSADASIYEVEPACIVVPKTIEDIVKTIRIAKKHNVSITPRGAATGITGGCLGSGIIIDTSKYLNRIIEINLEEEYAICEPGVIQDQLNEALAPHGYRLGPDTSTGNRATIGGMVSNNAAGSRSLYYGRMVDHVLDVHLALSNGEILHFSQLDKSDFDAKCRQLGTEGNLYRTIRHIQHAYRDEIRAKFPKIPRRVSGYNLDELVKHENFNLCKLVTGSEGSLGVLTQIKVRIAKKPKGSFLCLISLSDMIDGMNAVPTMLKHHPISLEMIDKQIINAGRQSPSLRGKLEWLEGNPEALFAAEFDSIAAAENFSAEMVKLKVGNNHKVISDPTTIQHVLDLRKAGLGLLLSRRTYSRAIAFLEDISVAPEELGVFMTKFKAFLKKYHKEAGIYGHVGSGCMHIRPYIDLRDPKELELIRTMMLEMTDLLIQHHGSLSGEHGDGLIRSWLNERLFGEKIYKAFVELKEAFDPSDMMNPGKIVNGPPLENNLKVSPQTNWQKIRTFLDFSKEGGFELSVDLCNGNGQCRKSDSVMCPSFQATHDEYDSTRARAQALRGIIHGQIPKESLSSQEIYDVLDLCLECKGCKTECPSQVDMAKMKSEVLYHYQKDHGLSLRSRLLAHMETWLEKAARFPRFSNWLSNNFIVRSLMSSLGFAKDKSLPQISEERFSAWFANKPVYHSEKKVVLFNDTYNEFIHPQVGKAAVRVLEKLGVEVIVAERVCCGRPLMSKGVLDEAKRKAGELVAALNGYADQGLQIIFLEPSCLSMIHDDFAGLLGYHHTAREAVSHVSTSFEGFLWKLLKDQDTSFFSSKEKKSLLFHGHCHQKADETTKAVHELFKLFPHVDFKEIASGCCGMAGSFGYEAEHSEISNRIGELKLFPAVRSAGSETIIVTNGFSCRSQILHGTNRQPLHIAEVIHKFII